MGRHRARGWTRARRRRRENDRPLLGPGGSSTFLRICPRSTCLDQWGLARAIAMRAPPAVINFGVSIGGCRTDGATYIAFLLSTKFENLEAERQLNSGTALIDFRVHA
eukprot:6087426-Pyramimonas_sp.AAC.1